MTPKEELQKTQKDLTEGGRGNPLILPSPEDQDPLASLLPWFPTTVFTFPSCKQSTFVFIPPHEHFSYLQGNTHWVEVNAGLTLSCFTNLTNTLPQRQPALWSTPACALGPRMNKLHLTFCSFQANFPAGHAWGGEDLQIFFLQGPLLCLKHCWGMLSLAHSRAALEIQQTKTCWRAPVLRSSSRCAATAWPGCDGRQLML